MRRLSEDGTRAEAAVSEQKIEKIDTLDPWDVEREGIDRAYDEGEITLVEHNRLIREIDKQNEIGR